MEEQAIREMLARHRDEMNKHNLEYFSVASHPGTHAGASIYSASTPNSAARHARKSHMEWEKPRGIDTKHDWSKEAQTYYHGSPTADIKELEPRLDPRLNLLGGFVAPELFSLMPERHKATINTTTKDGKFIKGEVTIPHKGWLKEKGYLYEFDNPKSVKERAKDRYMLTEKTTPDRVKEVYLKDVLARGWKVKEKQGQWEAMKKEGYYNDIIIENPKGSKKNFGKNYPIPVMTYPVDYGYLPGHMAEDDAELDFFKGTDPKKGLHGSFNVWRPDVKGEKETKFYTGTTPGERDSILAAYQKVLRDRPAEYITADELKNAVKPFLKQGEIKPSQVNNQTLQVTRQPRAVIVKGNPQYIKGNHMATKYYNDIADFLRQQNVSVTMDEGKPYTQPSKADLWVGHSRGTDRLRFAPKETQTLAFGSNLPNAINHPRDLAGGDWQSIQNYEPSNFHYIFTNAQKQAILDKLKKR
jgi:hypothetical protein